MAHSLYAVACYPQMKKIVIILIILISNLTFSQTEKEELKKNAQAKTETEFRTLKGKLTLENGQPFASQNVIIKGTVIGTQTDFNGNFCLIIPKNITVWIELPFCFDQIFREIEPTTETIEMQIGKGKRKTKKAWRNYEKNKVELNSNLNKIYSSDAYKTAKIICG